MPVTNAGIPRQKLLQVSIILAGGCILIFALMADRFGYGEPGRFGSGQFLLALISVAFILIGWQGRKIFNLYHAAALLLLNTLIMLALLELGAIAVARSGIFPAYRQNIIEGYKEMPYYSSQVWSDEYFQETRSAENYQYRPYVIWSHQPHSGDLVNVDGEGRRVTPGAQCSANAFKVFAFGGSSMWGWGSPDWGTIPAYLQQDLAARRKDPVCVINFGEDGFVSTQSMLLLILQLRSGNIPDMAVFYDGVNDVYAAYESGEAGNPVALSDLSAKFGEKEHPLVSWIKSSRLYTLVEAATIRFQLGKQKNLLLTETDKLADSVTEVYLSNYKIVASLAQQYDFDYYFFWQPHLAVGDKPLSPEEKVTQSRIDPALAALANAVYQNISLPSQEWMQLQNLANVFDLETEQIWIDEWGHITPEGNRLVAHEMTEILENSLDGE